MASSFRSLNFSRHECILWEKKNASALRNRMRIRGKKAGDRKAGCLSREKKVWKCIFFMRGENFITHTREDAFTLNWRSNKKWEGSEICLISPKWPREAFQTNAQRLGASYIYWSAFRSSVLSAERSSRLVFSPLENRTELSKSDQSFSCDTNMSEG